MAVGQSVVNTVALIPADGGTRGMWKGLQLQSQQKLMMRASLAYNPALKLSLNQMSFFCIFLSPIFGMGKSTASTLLPSIERRINIERSLKNFTMHMKNSRFRLSLLDNMRVIQIYALLLIIIMRLFND